jgi:hypothetical protein
MNSSQPKTAKKPSAGKVAKVGAPAGNSKQGKRKKAALRKKIASKGESIQFQSTMKRPPGRPKDDDRTLLGVPVT